MPSVLLVGPRRPHSPCSEGISAAVGRSLPGWQVIAASSSSRADARAVETGAFLRGLPAVIRAARDADAVVLAGSTVFDARAPANALRRAAAIATAARAARKPVALIGVGACALQPGESRSAVRFLARRAALLVLRDEESAGILAGAGAAAPFRVGADPTWAVFAPAGAAQRRERGGDRLTVALGCVRPGSRFIDALADALAHVAGQGVETVLQAWESGAPESEERRAAEALMARLDGRAVVRPPCPSLRAAADTLAQSRLVVGTRLHALVAAAAAGVPFVAIPDRPSVAALARRLEQPVVRGDAGSEELIRVLEAALEKPSLQPDAVGEEIERAERMFRLLRLFLTGGRGDDVETGDLPLVPQPWIE